MAFDSKIKLLLLKLNKQGHDASVTKNLRYSKTHGTVYSRWELTFWVKKMKYNKKTNQDEEKTCPNTYKFDNAIDLIKYMVSVGGKDENK